MSPRTSETSSKCAHKPVLVLVLVWAQVLFWSRVVVLTWALVWTRVLVLIWLRPRSARQEPSDRHHIVMYHALDVAVQPLQQLGGAHVLLL